jgi:L-fucose mutarotase/ribose pyranase (RbsD/FucU family)
MISANLPLTVATLAALVAASANQGRAADRATASEAGPPAAHSVEQTLAAALPRLGHRNWIVIADSAYPEQTGGGIETVYVGGDQLAAVKAVLAAVDAAKHVDAVALVDAELAAVADDDAPGVAAYREELDKLLAGRPVDKRPHEEIIGDLDEAGKLFRVLVLKTDMTVPYTSVFLRLECGYWSPEKEARLRQSLERGPRGRKAFDDD